VEKFEEAHKSFVQNHLDKRTGERRGRLDRGHAHAEILFAKQIWWPLKENFEDLHPEYEVIDWRGQSYFADYVYAPQRCRVLIEIKGFQSHVTNMDRRKYCNELNRETFLCSMGFHVISFAYDDVAHRPELCINLLRMVLSRFESADRGSLDRTAPMEREILRYAAFLAKPFRPIDVSQRFDMNHRTTVRHLKQLCQKGWLHPITRSTGQRILYYELTKQGLDNGLL